MEKLRQVATHIALSTVPVIILLIPSQIFTPAAVLSA